MASRSQRLERCDIGGLSIFVRQGTVDEDVLTAAYQEPRFFASAYEPGDADTILDVGAHIGVFMAIMASRVPRSRIYAIEPAKDNFQLLEKNISANDLSNVRLNRFALAQASGQVRLWRAVANWGHAISPSSLEGEHWDWELVEARSMEEFLAAENIPHVDYMKMNVKGAEYEILLNTRPRSLRIIASMLVEYHPVDNHSGEELIDWLRTCGYSTDLLPSRSDPGKGWITARWGA